MAAAGASRHCTAIGSEPELADDAARSFHTQTLYRIHNPPTIADGTRTLSLGKITLPLVLDYVHDMKTVSEEAGIAAVKYLFYRMKLVVEPSGALGLAALLSQAVRPEDRIGNISTGGNVDAATMTKVLRS